MGRMIRVLVTGAGGQLGRCLQFANTKFPNIFLDSLDKSDLDITNAMTLARVFKEGDYDYCINTAAFTNVNEAEKNPDTAFTVNSQAVEMLAKTCKEHGVCLIHMSTDYIFDGLKRAPYLPDDPPNPINLYGKSKLEGERHILEILDQYFIIRTSWLYSEFGANFVKNILKRIIKNQKTEVVCDQKGSPTYGGDLAAFLLFLINGRHSEYGIYHYCNVGGITWFDLAKQIASEMKITSNILPVSSQIHASLAPRPRYSVLSTEKTERTFKLTIPTWQQSLAREIEKISQSVLGKI